MPSSVSRSSGDVACRRSAGDRVGDDRERVAHLVRDDGGELAHRRELLLAHQLVLRRAQVLVRAPELVRAAMELRRLLAHLRGQVQVPHQQGARDAEGEGHVPVGREPDVANDPRHHGRVVDPGGREHEAPDHRREPVAPPLAVGPQEQPRHRHHRRAHEHAQHDTEGLHRCDLRLDARAEKRYPDAVHVFELEDPGAKIDGLVGERDRVRGRHDPSHVGDAREEEGEVQEERGRRDRSRRGDERGDAPVGAHVRHRDARGVDGERDRGQRDEQILRLLAADGERHGEERTDTHVSNDPRGDHASQELRMHGRRALSKRRQRSIRPRSKTAADLRGIFAFEHQRFGQRTGPNCFRPIPRVLKRPASRVGSTRAVRRSA